MKTYILKFMIVTLLSFSSMLSISCRADEGDDGNNDGGYTDQGSNNNDPQSYERSYWSAYISAQDRKYTSWGYTNSDGTTGTVTNWDSHGSPGDPGSPGSPAQAGACHVIGSYGIDCQTDSHHGTHWCFKTLCGGHGSTCYPEYQCDPPTAAVPPTPPTPPTFSVQLNDPGKTPSVHDVVTRTTISTHVDPVAQAQPSPDELNPIPIPPPRYDVACGQDL